MIAEKLSRRRNLWYHSNYSLIHSTRSKHPFPYIDLHSILAIRLRSLILRYTKYFHKRKFTLAHSDRCQHKAIDRKSESIYILSEYLNTFVGLK